MADIEIEIDGQKLTAKPNQTVIEVADRAGIYIPRFCYHKQLTVAANCRMCLVEVEKSPKALPACATPVMPGMKVFTKSQKTLEAQRAVMEFLLINHPLDCPICDQGGECELQDLSMGYGSSQSKYNECKRSVADQDLGPLIASEMTRCIYCTRCVRFGDEIAGLREMGAIGRGEHTEIGTYVTHAIRSEVSGNIIDLCPVGALTNKPYRFTARAWELNQAPSVSPHDCIGSNLNIHTRYGRVMRVVARENANINDMWIADRDRYSYTGLYHADRLDEPMARIDGRWEVVEWEKAFEMAAAGLQDCLAQFGADKLGALVSPQSTLEECYLLQKIVRGLGSPHIDHRLRDIDTHDQMGMPAFPGLSMPLADIDQCDTFLLIGTNLQKEQPLAALRVRKATRKGAVVLVVNPMDYRFNFSVTAKKIVAPQHMVEALEATLKALQTNASDDALATHLRDKQKACILLGAFVQHHPEASHLRYLAHQIAELSGATLGFMTDGANAAGAWLAGAIPHRQAGGLALNEVGLSAYGMLEKPRKAYLLLNVEPELDCANAQLATAALAQAKCVIALSMYRNPILEAHAHVIFPMAPFTETSGTFINAAGEWQSFKGVATSVGASRPAWKILRVLGNFLHLNGFDYASSEEVKQEVNVHVDSMPVIPMQLNQPATRKQKAKLMRLGEIPIYAVDSLVRRASPLQQAQTLMEGESDVLRLHPDTAKQFDLQEGERVKVTQHNGSLELAVKWDARVAKDTAWVAGGVAATSGLGDLLGEIALQKG
jgi:NADH-quinone oxidoreductase subunit G